MKPKEIEKNDLSGIPKDLSVKNMNNEIDNYEKLMSNHHELTRFRDMLSTLLKHPKYQMA
jgi:hypothetical protein